MTDEKPLGHGFEDGKNPTTPPCKKRTDSDGNPRQHETSFTFHDGFTRCSRCLHIVGGMMKGDANDRR